MSGDLVALLAIGALFLLIFLRLPIAVALFALGFGGVALLRGPFTAIYMIRTAPFEFLSHWSLAAVPMFILMGSIVSRSGMGMDLFAAARLWLGKVPGGLAVATNWASALFAASSGSSFATAAAMGRIAIPEMRKSGYDMGLATGVVASAGTLGALIPPSILFVFYGVFAEQSITRLLIAGVFPGILTAVVYSGMIMIRSYLHPELAPPISFRATLGEKLRATMAIWPVLVIIGGIFVGLYSGLVTATEAGAFGSLIALLAAAVSRRLSWKILFDSLSDAVATTAKIMMIAAGAAMFSNFLSVSGFPVRVGELVEAFNLSPLVLLLIVTTIFLLMGMVLDPMGILLLTLPILVPILEGSGINMIWFGVLAVKLMEIGCLTPPVGLNVYIVKGVVGSDVPLWKIFSGVGWFLACEVIVMVLLISFPAISTWLPAQMY